MMNTEEIKTLIPQRYPFLMLDRVVEIKPGESIKAYKNISINEDYFRGHFPDTAVFPGALTAEAMAQAACILFKKSMPGAKVTMPYITNMKIRFLKPVVPGDQLEVIVRSVKMIQTGGVFETEARVCENIIAKGEMTFACK